MTLQVRRVVTGHDENGKAVVKIDEISQRVFSNRPGATGCNLRAIWPRAYARALSRDTNTIHNIASPQEGPDEDT